MTFSFTFASYGDNTVFDWCMLLITIKLLIDTFRAIIHSRNEVLLIRRLNEFMNTVQRTETEEEEYEEEEDAESDVEEEEDPEETYNDRIQKLDEIFQNVLTDLKVEAANVAYYYKSMFNEIGEECGIEGELPEVYQEEEDTVDEEEFDRAFKNASFEYDKHILSKEWEDKRSSMNIIEWAHAFNDEINKLMEKYGIDAKENKTITIQRHSVPSSDDFDGLSKCFGRIKK